MSHPLRCALTILAALLGLCLALALPSIASAAPGSLIGHSAAKGSGQKTVDYWTKKRLRSTDPLPTPVANAPAPPPVPLSAPGDTSFRPAPFDQSRSIPGRPPAPSSSAAATTTAPRVKAPYGSAAIPPQLLGTYPYTTNGKVFGKFRGIGRFSCSGTAVRSGSRSVVLTAGHCVHERRAGFARNLIFIPSYEFGLRPFGSFPFRYEATTRSYARTENPHFDYAAFKVKHNSRSKKSLGATVGELGIAYGQRRKQLFAAIGYPSNLGNGELMWTCLAPFAGKDSSYRAPGPKDSAIGCNMGPGASGGGWIINRRGRQYVNSISSYIYRSLPNVLFGPYFTKGVRKLVGTVNRH